MKRTITVTTSPSAGMEIFVARKSVGGLSKADSRKLAKLISEVA